jgi:hypothetical protein
LKEKTNNQLSKKEKERKTTQAVKTTPHMKLRKKKATLVPSTVKLLYRRQKRPSQGGPEQSTRRNKEVTKRLEHQAQTSKSARNCRAELRV